MITKKVQMREIGIPTLRATFYKGAQNDVYTFTEDVNYVEKEAAISLPIRGVENINIVVGGGHEPFVYDYSVLSSAAVDADNHRKVTFAEEDLAALPTGVFLHNEASGEYFMIVSKLSATEAICQRGMYGTTPVTFAASDVITILNRVKLTSEITGYGILFCTEMPTPGTAQDFARN